MTAHAVHERRGTGASDLRSSLRGRRPEHPCRPFATDDDLRRLLARSAEDDLEAFLEFYDATCDDAWRLEMWRLRDAARAADATCERYVTAWLRAGGQPASGLSPRAWLLTLNAATAR